MATWDKGQDTFFCPHCGAKYERHWTDYPERDQGTKNCDCCHKEMWAWKGARDYGPFILLERGTVG